MHTISVSCNVLSSFSTGNAGNPLARLPVFQRLLSETALDIAVLAVAPRSYWKSRPSRATERGILSDYQAVLRYATREFPDANVVLYGHSLGGAIAVCLTSRLKAEDFPKVNGLILENPFASIPGMVKAMYPQRWLPYHHMGPLVFDKWDALQAMRDMPEDALLWKLSHNLLVLLSEKDEIVPPDMGRALFDASYATRLVRPDAHAGRNRRLVPIGGALHETAWMKREWVNHMTQYLTSFNSSL